MVLISMTLPFGSLIKKVSCSNSFPLKRRYGGSMKSMPFASKRALTTAPIACGPRLISPWKSCPKLSSIKIPAKKYDAESPVYSKPTKGFKKAVYGTKAHLIISTNDWRSKGIYIICVPVTGTMEHGLYQFSTNFFSSIQKSCYVTDAVSKSIAA